MIYLVISSISSGTEKVLGYFKHKSDAEKYQREYRKRVRDPYTHIIEEDNKK